MDKYLSRRELLQSSLLVAGLGAGAWLLAACGGENAATPTAVSASGKTVSFDLTAGDSVEYSTDKLQVEAGSKIVLTFTNKSTDKLFNWVLAQPGKMLRVATDGAVENEASGYLKANDENVVVHTRLLKAGESETVTFDAPPPGEYQFFCTFPGYYTRMNGVLTVK